MKQISENIYDLSLITWQMVGNGYRVQVSYLLRLSKNCSACPVDLEDKLCKFLHHDHITNFHIFIMFIDLIWWFAYFQPVNTRISLLSQELREILLENYDEILLKVSIVFSFYTVLRMFNLYLTHVATRHYLCLPRVGSREFSSGSGIKSKKVGSYTILFIDPTEDIVVVEQEHEYSLTEAIPKLPYFYAERKFALYLHKNM